MRGSFFEYNVAISGLFTAKAALNVVSHNVSNASIKGYTRQYAELRASTPISLGTGKGMIGTGSELYGIGQIRDFYLDKKLWTHSPTLGEYTVKKTQLTLTETIFNEFSETGLITQMNDFFKRMQDLVTNSGDMTYRTNVIQQAGALSTYIKSTYEALQHQQSDINAEVLATVQVINSLGQQITSLNKLITVSEYDGSRANDLRDQRALLVDQLSQYVNIDVKEIELNDDYAMGKYPEPEYRSKSEKQFVIQINGYDFVKHYDLHTLECVERETADNQSVYLNPEDADGLYDIYFTGTNTKFNIYSDTLSGQLKGLIDLRDGNNGKYTKGESIDFLATQVKLNVDLADLVSYDPNGGTITLDINGVPTVFQYSSFEYLDPADEDNNPDKKEIILNIDIASNDPPLLSSHVKTHMTDAYVIETDNSKLYMTVDANDTRIDLNESGGIIKLRDNTTGITRDYKYTSYTMVENPDGTVQFEFIMAAESQIPSNVSNETYSSSIGQTTNYKGIPYYMGKINEFVRAFARAMNEGVNLKGDALEGFIGHVDAYNTYDDTIGTLFFTYSDFQTGEEIKSLSDFNINRLNGTNFIVNSDLSSDPRLMATAQFPSSGSGESDNNAVLGYLKIQTSNRLFKEGNINDFVNGMSGELGIDLAQAVRFEANYVDVTMSIDYQRMSISSVSLNEEMTNMIKFQQQYNAAAKLVNVIDSIYDTLVNRLGNF